MANLSAYDVAQTIGPPYGFSIDQKKVAVLLRRLASEIENKGLFVQDFKCFSHANNGEYPVTFIRMKFTEPLNGATNRDDVQGAAVGDK